MPQTQTNTDPRLLKRLTDGDYFFFKHGSKLPVNINIHRISRYSKEVYFLHVFRTAAIHLFKPEMLSDTNNEYILGFLDLTNDPPIATYFNLQGKEVIKETINTNNITFLEDYEPAT